MSAEFWTTWPECSDPRRRRLVSRADKSSYVSRDHGVVRRDPDSGHNSEYAAEVHLMSVRPEHQSPEAAHRCCGMSRRAVRGRVEFMQ